MINGYSWLKFAMYFVMVLMTHDILSWKRFIILFFCVAIVEWCVDREGK